MATILRVRATIGQSSGTVPCLLTTYWDSTGAGLAALATESVARVRAAFAAMSPSLATGTSFTPNLLVDEIDENTGSIVNQVAASAPAATAGAAAGSLLPLQTMVVAQYQTATFIAGRRLRGRSYIPGLTTGAIGAGGTVVVAVINAINAWNTALGTTVVTATNQRVWHRPDPVTHVGGLSAVVASRSANTQFAVMRSRRR